MVLFLTDHALLILLLKVAEWNIAWEQNFKNQRKTDIGTIIQSSPLRKKDLLKC